jgi:aspartate/methionine/tyrosine aminotransferase
VKFLGKQVQVIHTKYENRWRLTPEELDEALSKNLENHEKHEIRNKFMILTYPDNPTGLTYSPTELEGLATVARKHNLIVVSD